MLLPTTSSKLTARWQGPYEILRSIGKVNYLVNLHDRRKSKRVFHVNMLREWHAPTSTNYFVEEATDDTDLEDVMPSWRDKKGGQIKFGEELSSEQKEKLKEVLDTYADVLTATPGCTNLASHTITTGDARPLRLPPYRLPQAYRAAVKQELTEMLDHGIIEPSSSDWASPIVLVGKKDGTLRLCVDYRKLNSVSNGCISNA